MYFIFELNYIKNKFPAKFRDTDNIKKHDFNCH